MDACGEKEDKPVNCGQILVYDLGDETRWPVSFMCTSSGFSPDAQESGNISVVMRMLSPTPGLLVDLASAYPSMPVRASRPWVVLSMIASIDGAISASGTSGTLGGPADKAVFARLRSRADVIIVGAGTAISEDYQPLRRNDQHIGIVTASGKLPWERPLYSSPGVFLITPVGVGPFPLPTIQAGSGQADVATAIDQLDASLVLVEGGPRLNGPLLAAGRIDEICITIAPLIIAGSVGRLAADSNEVFVAYTLVHVLESDGLLFCRYIRTDRTDD